jgi:GNAT superfamily N-acetyltransferase
MSAAVVVETAGDAHAKMFVQSWVPYHLAKQFREPTWTYRLFPWDRIIAASYMASFAARVEGSCEGFLAIQRAPDVFKVAFLAAAPWNYGEHKAHRGIGSGLLAYAVQLADNEGFAEIRLSATPEAETFYERIGWVRTGKRDYEDLPIFSLPLDHVPMFLAKYPPLPKKG